MSRFATLDSVRKKDEGDGAGRDSYYGGAAAGASGTSVYGAGGKPKNADQLDKIFSSASRAAPADGDTDESKAPSTTITFWSNGFQVDDGPFRDSEEPANKAFLAEVEKGYVPRELREAGKGRNIVVKDKRSEKYKPPTPPPYVAFSGAGNSMAGAGGGVDTSSAAVGVAGAGATAEFAVDPSKPTTNVRVTLTNGKRQVFKFNRTHTVGDLLAQVASATAVTGVFALLAGFPPKPLTDASLTLEAAGLLNASVRMSMV